MAGNVAPIPCPKCGGKMWNNVGNKRNPRAPDYRCKDKENCDGGVWLKDSEKAALAVTSRNGTSPNRPPVVLDKMMRECVKAAQEIGNELFKDGSTAGLDFALTLNMATTLYISRCKSEGILHVEKAALEKLAAKMAAEKAEQERQAAFERARLQPTHGSGPDEDGWPLVPDSDLPF